MSFSPEQNEQAVKKLVRIQALLFMVIFVIGADTFLVSPLLPFISRDLAIPVGTTGLLVTSYAISYAVLAFVFGPLSDSIGRRKMIVWGMLSFAFFYFLLIVVKGVL